MGLPGPATMAGGSQCRGLDVDVDEASPRRALYEWAITAAAASPHTHTALAVAVYLKDLRNWLEAGC